MRRPPPPGVWTKRRDQGARKPALRAEAEALAPGSGPSCLPMPGVRRSRAGAGGCVGWGLPEEHPLGLAQSAWGSRRKLGQEAEKAQKRRGGVRARGAAYTAVGGGRLRARVSATTQVEFHTLEGQDTLQPEWVLHVVLYTGRGGGAPPAATASRCPSTGAGRSRPRGAGA